MRPTPYQKLLRKKLHPLLVAGTMASNLCYNLKQDSDLNEGLRNSLDDAERAWDKAILTLPKWMK